MSWSIQAVGKPKAVAIKIAEAMTVNKCAEPEETLRQGVGVLIAASLAAMPDTDAVRINAFGSQSNCYVDGKSSGKFTNSLKVEIEPIYGFVE